MRTNEIVLSRGIYHMVLSHIKKDKELTEFNKSKLMDEMQSAKIVASKQIPGDVVTINTKITVRDIETDQEYIFDLVAPTEARAKRNKLSVLSPMGLALLGYNVGEQVKWEMPEGVKTFVIEQVSAL